MTEPTNDEIDALVAAYLGDCGPQATRVYSFARAVLSKWGTPTPPAVVEPLTDEQIVGVMHSISINAAPSYHIAFARAIEAANGIKGGQHGTE